VRLVIDTNVLVSGMLSPLGPPGRIITLLASGRLEPCTDGRVLAEYETVLRRDSLRIDPDAVDELLQLVLRYGLPVGAPPLEMDDLPDPSDQPFVEVALAGGAGCLVTGNGAHFPRRRCVVPVVTPAELVEVMGRLHDAASVASQLRQRRLTPPSSRR
jgi:putative PIN family toxin of toxin-antitoxin system